MELEIGGFGWVGLERVQRARCFCFCSCCFIKKTTTTYGHRVQILNSGTIRLFFLIFFLIVEGRVQILNAVFLAARVQILNLDIICFWRVPSSRLFTIGRVEFFVEV